MEMQGHITHMDLAGILGSLLAVPVLGSIPAGRPVAEGQPLDACSSIDPDMLRLPKGTRVFAVRVRGDSMKDAGIHEGDFVFLEFRDPKNGDIVAALIDGECTLKRYVMHRGRPFLKAENENYPALIPAQELVIQGVQVAVLRLTA